MELTKRIVRLRSELLEFKASQLMGSSVAVMRPVYQVDTTLTVNMLMWCSWRIRAESPNPLIMPVLDIRFDGVPSGSDNNTAAVDYDRYESALNFERSTGVFEMPDIYTGAFNILLMPRVWNVACQVSIKGVIYCTSDGKVENINLG